jgi:hypothetical protein
MSTAAIRNGTATRPVNDVPMDLLKVDERLNEEMQRLAAINQELLGKSGHRSQETLELPEDADELALLRAENAMLRSRVEELEQGGAAAGEGDSAWAERQKEYEALLEEKSEVIRGLHLKVQELHEAGPAESSATGSASVESLKKEMAEQRRQLEEDEESLMQQMRQMEMAMSKDRAELARQRNEIQRLHNELNREIENAARDPGLRERLIALKRLQGEVMGRKQTNPAPAPSKAAEPQPAAPPVNKSKNSGLFGRIFGK